LLLPVLAVLLLGGHSGSMLVVVAALAAGLVAGYVNAFNFMDGINGISGTTAVVVGVFLAIVAHAEDETALCTAGLAIAGGALGFLPFNVPRAVIFLGDVGSYFIGAWLAALALLVVDSGAAPVVVVAPFLLYLLDTISVLVKRARRGDSLMQAHREHAYQRLVALGWSHTTVACLCAAITVSCAGLALAVRERSDAAQVLVLAVCAVIVGVYLVLPTMLESRTVGRA
jgi:UDP-GlcNAc:undecaprenyl-phosphate GlcNAc-1-phosphate transferase